MKRCPLNSIVIICGERSVEFGLGSLVDGSRMLTPHDFTVRDAIGPVYDTWPDADPAPESSEGNS